MKKIIYVCGVILLFLLVGCQTIYIQPINNTLPSEPSGNNTNTTITLPEENSVPFATLHQGNLTAYFIDVSQGDAIFIVTPDDKTMLIDGGEKEYGNAVVNFIRNLGYIKIDYVLATHPDADHIGGLAYSISKLKPSLIFDNGQRKDTLVYKEYNATWTSNHNIVSYDSILDFGDAITFFIVPYDDGNGFSSNMNDNSILLKVTYGNINYLFTGDCGEDCEIRVSDSDLRADVLKVGHHGSCTSSITYFLNKVKPKYSVISVGDNNYGHPCQDTLSRLNIVGSKVYRTDEKGTIIATTDGKNVTIITLK